METMRQRIRKSKMLMPVILILGLVGGIVVAQLVSNRIQQDVIIRGIDGQIELTAVTTLPSSEWFDTPMGLTVHINRIRPIAGFVYLQINNSDLTGISPADIYLRLSHADISGTIVEPLAVKATTIIDANCIQFKETLWLFEAEQECDYGFEITWLPSAVSGNYSVSVYMEGT